MALNDRDVPCAWWTTAPSGFTGVPQDSPDQIPGKSGEAEGLVATSPHRRYQRTGLTRDGAEVGAACVRRLMLSISGLSRPRGCLIVGTMVNYRQNHRCLKPENLKTQSHIRRADP